MKGRRTLARTRLALAGLYLMVFCGCPRLPDLSDAYRYEVPSETGDGWPTASLSAKGMEPGPFVDLMNRLQQQEDHRIHSILVVRHGSLVFEEYFAGGDVDLRDERLLRGDTLNLVWKEFTRDVPHFCASVTKSVTSQLLGIAVDRGIIAGTDETMFSFFPDYAEYQSADKDRITLHHMLTMTAGLPFDENTHPIADDRNDARRLFFSDDPLAFTLGTSVVDEPGSTYRYNSGTTVLLGEIIRRASGMSVPAFAERHLFGPLRIRSYEWVGMAGAGEVTHSAGGLYLRPRDMAKIGQLMLDDGLWNGDRVLSSEWVRRSLTPEIATPGLGNQRGCGYQWRIGRFGGFDAYWAAGWGGQYVIVLPELDLVFVQTGGQYRGENIPVSHVEILEAHILPAVRRAPGREAAMPATTEQE